MEIPQSIKDKIKCSECDELLSCGPVYLLHNTGGTICGRCSQQQPDETESNENERTRNDPYEATASLLLFPCAFAPRGCREKVAFALGQPAHESSCEYRPFMCPVAVVGSCGWIGSSRTLHEHCRDAHPTHLFENPCLLPRPDVTRSHFVNYIIAAFHLLFLVHLKVCVSSGQLFHSVRMFGENTFLNKFSYTLEVEGNNYKLTQNGSVFQDGFLTNQEPTAISTTINSLLDFLNGKYNESKFTITINCINCLKVLDSKVNSNICKKTFEKCKFHEKGCSFIDINKDKYWKHKKYFCKYQKKCYLRNCGVNFVSGSGSFIEHLSSSTSCRKTIKSINSVVRVTKNTNGNYNFIIFSSNNIGTIICPYFLSNSNLTLWMYSSLPFNELKNFKCLIKLTDPQTKYFQLLTPQIRNNNYEDWYIDVNINNFPSIQNNVGLEIKINIK